MFFFKNHIILDRTNTWPNEILSLISNDEKSIKGFFNEEHRIDKLVKDDLSIRFNRPENIHQENFEGIIYRMEKILKNYSIVGIHCTKLLDYEIVDIRQNGLKPLSKEFAIQRINKAYKKKLISKELRDVLKNKEELNESNRIGKIFVFHCLSTLEEEGGLNRLFGYWGGESLFAYIKNPQELKTIGIPCIILTSIKINELEIYPELSKRMIALYFDDNYYPHDNDSIIEKKLIVLKIIKRDEKLFEDLTKIHYWNDNII